MLVKNRLAPGPGGIPDGPANDKVNHDKDDDLKDDINSKRAILFLRAQVMRTTAECAASDCQGDILHESDSTQSPQKRIVSLYRIFVKRSSVSKSPSLLLPTSLLVPNRLTFSDTQIDASLTMWNA